MEEEGGDEGGEDGRGPESDSMMDLLPPELHLLIADHLSSLRDAGRLSQVSNYWHQLMEDEYVWQGLYEKCLGGWEEKKALKEKRVLLTEEQARVGQETDGLVHRYFDYNKKAEKSLEQLKKDAEKQKREEEKRKKEAEETSEQRLKEEGERNEKESVWNLKDELKKAAKAASGLPSFQERIVWACTNGYDKYLEHILLHNRQPLTKRQTEVLRGPTAHMKRTPLHMAVVYGNTRLAEFLLKKGVPHSSVDLVGDTPLMLTFQYGRPEIARLLLRYGAPLKYHQPLSLTANPLITASAAGCNELIELFFANTKITPQEVLEQFEANILCATAKAGHIHTMRMWLETYQATITEVSILHAAIESARLEMVEYILSNTTHIKRPDEPGKSRLDLNQGEDGAKAGLLNKRWMCRSAMELVLDITPATVGMRNVEKIMAQERTRKRSGTRQKSEQLDTLSGLQIKMFDLLLAAGADINHAVSTTRGPPLAYAVCLLAPPEVMVYLLSRGADPYVGNLADILPASVMLDWIAKQKA